MNRWNWAADSYGKVRHSRKACVYTVLRGAAGGEVIQKVAAQIPNWDDAQLIAAAPLLFDALVQMNRQQEGYCICALEDGLGEQTRHASFCQDARYALAFTLNRTYGTGELLLQAFEAFALRVANFSPTGEES